MKKLITIVLLVLSISGVFGQESNNDYYISKHEISIVIDDIFAKNTFASYPIVYYTTSSYIPYYIEYSTIDLNTPKIGLGYKYHFSKSALRSKISVGLRNYESDDKNSERKNEYSFLTSNISLGYELHKNMNKAQIFYGIDLFMNFNNTTSKHTNYGNTPNTSSENIYKYTGFGVSPLIGAKYYLSTAISISTELKYSIESYSGESFYKNSENAEDDKTKTKGINTKFGPLGQISINIHL